MEENLTKGVIDLPAEHDPMAMFILLILAFLICWLVVGLKIIFYKGE